MADHQVTGCRRRGDQKLKGDIPFCHWARDILVWPIFTDLDAFVMHLRLIWDALGMRLGCIVDAFGMHVGCVWGAFGMHLGRLNAFGMRLEMHFRRIRGTNILDAFGMHLECMWDAFGT